jgi:hypothetical protein
MFNAALMRGIQTHEYIKINGLASFFKEAFYSGRKAIIFEKNLSELEDQTKALGQLNTEMIEIDAATVRSRKLSYRFKNRQLKTPHYLEKGYRGFGIVNGTEIVGEMWYYGDAKNTRSKPHPDLDWLDLELAANEAYAFDWFVVPQERGNNLAGIFQKNALHSLSRKGYAKAFAYVWADNTPALWSTKFVNKWTEIRTERMDRFLLTKFNKKSLNLRRFLTHD